jgi:D-glycero-D-manno-heptose 1,7-bisphosphate phosphatase
LQAAGYLLIVVTNQSGIARGMFSVDQYQRFEQHMADELESEGVKFDGVYFCPHHEGGAVKEFAIACECRKPGPGMLKQAIADFHIDVAQSLLIGDKYSDIEAGRAAGVRRCYLVRSDAYETSVDDQKSTDGVFSSLQACIAHLAAIGQLN